jgi:peptidoglycan/xylan/chitin deacetylase (PgdA/CDA1 family)
MSGKNTVIRLGLEGVWLTRAHALARPFLGGLGVILTLHCVRPEEGRAFAPNRILKITPEFLDAALTRVAAAGLDIVSLDEAVRRVKEPGGRRFACFTLDDGYRDNAQFAQPIFRRHEAPFLIYVPTAYPEGRGEMWWLALEEVIAANDRIELKINGEETVFETVETAGKTVAFDAIYRFLRRIGENEQRAAIRNLCERCAFDLEALTRSEIMSWSEIAQIAKDPLCTIGAHTVDHFELAKLEEGEARAQMQRSADIIEAQLGTRPRHFSYPYGAPSSAGEREFRLARELGFQSAVTTRPGVLYAEHAQHLTALPRISLNGDFQSLRYLDVLLSGLPSYLWNRFERLNVA